MKFATAVILASVLFTVPSFAQQRDRAQQLRQANRKITIGLVLMAVGAVVAPWNTPDHRLEGDAGGGVALKASIGMVAVGSGLAWWGATERRRVLQPQTMVGVDVGKGVGIRFRRVW